MYGTSRGFKTLIKYFYKKNGHKWPDMKLIQGLVPGPMPKSYKVVAVMT